MRSLYVVGAVLTAVSASAGTVQLADVGARPAGWTDALSFARSDPAAGVLTGVTLDLTGSVGGTLRIENRDSAARAVTTDLTGSLTVALPNGQTWGGVSPTARTRSALGAFDGTVDYAGTSGATVALERGSASTTLALGVGSRTGGLPVSAFEGAGTVALPVEARVTSRIAGGGNMTGDVAPVAGASGRLTYSYAAPGSPGDTFGVVVILTPPLPPAVFLPGGLTRGAVQTRTVASAATGWSTVLGFDAFDAARGTLRAVSLTMTVPTRFDWSLTGDDLARIATEQGSSLALSLDGTTLATSGTSAYSSGSLVAGARSGGTDRIGTNRTFVIDDALLTGFTSPGGVALGLTSSGTGVVEGAGAFGFDLSAIAGGTVRLRYLFEATAVPAPATGGLLLFGLAAIASRRRRTR